MRNLLIIIALTAASAFVLACSKTDASSANAGPVATNATPDPRFSPAPVYTAPAAEPVQDDAPRISLADAKKDFDGGSALFIDTRADTLYAQEHIKGAINITYEALKEKMKGLPKDKPIIAYCS